MAERLFLLAGLTGGIATGKSTVAAVFRALGAVVIDADVLAREVVEPGEPALAEIAREFGSGVLQADGRLDRKALGAIVFVDADKRRRLEALTHPRIRERFLRHLMELEAQDFRGVVFFDAPVMIESGNYKNMDRLVVVVTDEATQIARLMARDGISREEALQKIRSQMPLAEKAKLADHVIDNSGDTAATEAQVRRVYDALLTELRVSSLLLKSEHQRTTAPLGVVFPINMGNRGQNEIAPAAVFTRLRAGHHDVVFLGYHWRRSGNFIFVHAGTDAEVRAVRLMCQVTSLECVGRSFCDLARLDWLIPSDVVVTRGGSIQLNDSSGFWRVIAVFLGEPVDEKLRLTGPIGRRIRILSWVSERDMICAYDRLGEAGDVGQVTAAVVHELSTRGGPQRLVGSGRAAGVVREILRGRGLRSA